METDTKVHVTTVRDLIEQLQKFPLDTIVEHWPSEFGGGESFVEFELTKDGILKI